MSGAGGAGPSESAAPKKAAAAGGGASKATGGGGGGGGGASHKKKPSATKAGGVSKPQGTAKGTGGKPTGGDPRYRDVPMKGIFARDLKPMMYGFGDVEQPLDESVELVEDILLQYVTDLLHKGAHLAALQGKLGETDLMLLVRRDPKKLARMQELLTKNEEIKQAKKIFDDTKMVS